MVDKNKEISETAEMVARIIKNLSDDPNETKKMFGELGKKIEENLNETEPAWYIS